MMDREDEIRALTRTLGRITDLHDGSKRDEKPITATEVGRLQEENAKLKDVLAERERALVEQDQDRYDTLTKAERMLWYAIRDIPGRHLTLTTIQQEMASEKDWCGDRKILRVVDESDVVHLLAIDYQYDLGTEIDFTGIPEHLLRNAGWAEQKSLPLYQTWKQMMQNAQPSGPDDKVRKVVDERFGEGSYNLLLEVERDGETALYWDDIKADDYKVTFGRFDEHGWFPLDDHFLRRVKLTHDVKAIHKGQETLTYYDFDASGPDFFNSRNWNESEDVLRVINHHYKEWLMRKVRLETGASEKTGGKIDVSEKRSYPLFGTYNEKGWRPGNDKFLNRIRQAYKIHDEETKEAYGPIDFQNKEFNFVDWHRIDLENFWKNTPNISKVILDHYVGWQHYMQTYNSAS